MSTEYLPVAERIAAAAAQGGLSVAELKEIVSAQCGEINCYPGEPGVRCQPLAVFVALYGKLRKGRGHYNCAQILEEMVRHLQGRCPDTTRQVVLILDAWWHDHYEKWRANIETIKRSGVRVEGCLIRVCGWVAPLQKRYNHCRQQGQGWSRLMVLSATDDNARSPLPPVPQQPPSKSRPLDPSVHSPAQS